MKQYTQYTGGFLHSSIDHYIRQFWQIVEHELTVEEQGLLLKFVTSCSRPPSLGFKVLTPPFTIQRVDCQDDQRLPTASTCFNILKLPTYSSPKILKEKLLFVIHSKAGFDLS
jgi:ubiquitin-protein ligase E3 C